MFKKTLTLRRAILLVVVFGLLGPALIISGYSWFKTYDEDVQKRTQDLLEQNADVLSNGMQEPLWNINTESGTALVDAMMTRNEDIIRIEVRDTALGLFVSGERPERRVGYTASTEKPVIYRGSTIGSIKLEVGSARLRRIMVQNLKQQMIALAAQIVISIVLILMLLEKRLVRPLQRLGKGAERLAGRQLDVPFTWRRLDEIGLLSQRLDDTRISLRRLFEELDNKNRELEQDIDKRKRMEQAQRLSEAKFAGAFQCNPDSVSIARINDGIILDVNQTFEKITGYTRDEAVGRTATELNIWIDTDQQKMLIDTLKQQEMVREFAWRMLTKNGEARQCLTNATIFSVGGEQYMLAVIRDVTDQRLLEEQKAEADRALLRLAQGTQELAGDSFFELLVADLASALRIDLAFIALRVPDAPDRLRTIATQVKGHTAEDFEYGSAGTPCEYTLKGDICVFSAGVRDRFQGNAAFTEHGWDSYAGAPLRDAAGNTIGVLAVMHAHALSNPDLVKSMLRVFSERASAELERKRAEEALRASELRFSTIFQSSPVAMFVTQVRGNYVVKDVNGAFERLFLRSRESVIGRNTFDLSLYSDPADRAAMIEELKETGSTDHRHEVWMNRGDGSRVLVQFSGHTFVLSGDKFGILACDDITDKRRVENEIRELNANLELRVIERTEALQRANEELASTLATLNLAQGELVRSEKLAALGSLVAGIAHELNTPIGNSLMVASTLVDQTKALSKSYTAGNGLKRSALEGYIGDAGKAGDILVRNLYRAANLVTSFKQVAVDQTSSQRREFALAEVVDEIMLTMWPTLKKSAYRVEQHIPDDLLLDSYPGPLGQVVTNLVNNALLHGFEGRSSGTVTITALSSAAGWLALTVHDDGVGIPAANLNRIFDPFFTTKLGAGGSGLGLNITHNIVSGILGGKIHVDSEIGVGTTFRLTLPMIAPQRQPDEFPLRVGNGIE